MQASARVACSSASQAPARDGGATGVSLSPEFPVSLVPPPAPAPAFPAPAVPAQPAPAQCAAGTTVASLVSAVPALVGFPDLASATLVCVVRSFDPVLRLSLQYRLRERQRRPVPLHRTDRPATCPTNQPG